MHRWNPINDHGTSHLAVVDEEPNAVSLTTTVNKFFGSQIISPGTGIVLNNEMDDSSINSHRHQPISLGLGKGHYHPSLLLFSLTSIFILISYLNSKMYYWLKSMFGSDFDKVEIITFSLVKITFLWNNDVWHRTKLILEELVDRWFSSKKIVKIFIFG